MFSSRVPENLAANRLTRALDRLRVAGTPIIDLTESNPTRVGLRYPPESLEPLADTAGLIYEPQPLGLPAARRAVAAALARRGVSADSDRIILTSSTSEAYSLLFKLLCDPGDAVLVPRPSYPLFEHLTRLDGVTPVPYSLEYHDRWLIDPDDLSRALTPRARAVLLVNPNNPTGSYVKPAELDAIAAICRSGSLALIGDEVFSAYRLGTGAATVSSVLDQKEALTFSLGGPVQSGRLTPGQAGVDHRPGSGRAGRARAGQTGAHLRHLSLGVHAGAACGPRPVRGWGEHLCADCRANRGELPCAPGSSR